MFDDIPSPNFGLNFDPSHMIWQQMDYLAPLAEFRDRIFHVHAKDARIDRAALDQHGVLSYPKLWHTPKIPGLGDVRWGAFFGALSDAGYDGHVAIEVEDRAFEGALESRLDSLVDQPAPPAAVHQGIIRRYLASIEKKSGMTTPVDTRREEKRSRPAAPRRLASYAVPGSLGADPGLQRGGERRAAARRARRRARPAAPRVTS